MQYFEAVNTFFKEKFEDIISENPLKNYLETSIFYLVNKIIQEGDNGSFFIKVPMRELGATDYSTNYQNFCGAIAFAAGMNVYNRNINNEISEINNGEYFYSKEIYIKQGQYGLRYDTYGARNNTTIELKKSKYPRLLNANKYVYNNKNGLRKIHEFIDWVKHFYTTPRILNDVGKKILIISHGEIEKSMWTESIPYCLIQENSIEYYSSPIEPFIYLAREGENVTDNLLLSKIFDTVIFIGDSKFQTGGKWSLRHKHFKNIIYIGGHQPDGATEYYSYSPNEIHKFYGVADSAIFFGKKEVNFKTLNYSIQAFIEKVNEIKTNGGGFRFSILPILNRTAPINKDLREKMEKWFDDYLINNLTNAGDDDITSLTELYTNILISLENGNEAKIKELNPFIKEDLRKNDNLFLIVSQKDEIAYFSKLFGIKKEHIFLLKSFSRKMRTLFNSGKFNNKETNQFIFLAYVNSYHDILKMMDAFSILGKRIFIGNKDSRFDKMVKERQRVFNKLLQSESRSSITTINYAIQNDDTNNEQKEALSLDDFIYTDDFEFYINNRVNVDNYTITLGENETITLNGSVVVEDELVDVADLKINDDFHYYQNDSSLFSEVLHIVHPQLATDIDEHSQVWKSTLNELNSHFGNKAKELFDNLLVHKWKTGLPTLQGYLREDCQTQFPRVSSLVAIKKLCENLDGFRENDFILKFDGIRKAQKATSISIELGRTISKSLLESKIGKEPNQEFINKIGADLWKQLQEKCLKQGKVIKIEKNK